MQHTSLRPQSNTDVLIGLHAVYARDVLLAWDRGPRVAVVTGTDLRGSSKDLALDTLRQVEAIVVLQPLDLLELDASLVQKSRVILPSVELPVGLAWRGHDSTTACCVGHLREVKNPLSLPTALITVRKWKGIHLGAELEPGWGEKLQGWERFKWLGELSRARTLRRMSLSGCFVIPSFVEGCSNALCEAVALGMPIIASDIPGNRGLLGDDFRGYFPAREPEALASLLSGPKHFANQGLTNQLRPVREAKALANLICDLFEKRFNEC